jgi:hypothetical protein
MSKDLLTEEYFGKKDQIQQDWQIKVEAAKVNGTAVPDHPQLPAFPSEDDIIKKAASLNGFVSNIPVEIKPKSKSST